MFCFTTSSLMDSKVKTISLGIFIPYQQHFAIHMVFTLEN
jgi:hypothetical protein